MRPLRHVPPVPGKELYDALRSALDGSGPAVVPAGDHLPPLPTEVDDDVCLVVPTSGSTGTPKGVLLTASALEASRRATADRIGEGRWWLTLPLTHIAGLQVVLRSLAAGFEPSADPEGCSLTSLVPTQLRRVDPVVLQGFSTVLLGGAAAPADLPANVVTTYGMSETCGGCVYDGVPLDGVRFDVADTVVLSGPVVAQGYTTGERFDGTFVTRDLGLVQDGRLTVLGRADDVINTGGEKVSPAAVEAVLSSLVEEVVVLGVPDEEWGERVVAFVVGDLPLETARDVVARALGRPAAPKQVVILDTLPLLPTGKVDRVRLRSSAR